MALLYLYMGVTMVQALRLGWHMAYRLDRYDWRFGEVWMSFWLTVVLWPLLLLKPRAFLKILITPPFGGPIGGGIGGVNLAARERELDHLRRNPPPWGTYVRFHTRHGEGMPASALTFPTAMVEKALAPLCTGSRALDILNWVKRRDVCQDATSDVPAAWGDQFQCLAADLIEQGHGVAQCGSCGRRTPSSELAKETFSVIGHSFHFWRCACGNLLLQVPGIHVHAEAGGCQH